MPSVFLWQSVVMCTCVEGLLHAPSCVPSLSLPVQHTWVRALTRLDTSVCQQGGKQHVHNWWLTQHIRGEREGANATMKYQDKWGRGGECDKYKEPGVEKEGRETRLCFSCLVTSQPQSFDVFLLRFYVQDQHKVIILFYIKSQEISSTVTSKLLYFN